jgi:hypothetical protein
LRSIETGAGIAGKDFGEIRGLWPETAIAFSTAELVQLAVGRKAPPRKKTRWLLWLEDTSKWTCLAVQQQLIEPDSHADYSFYGANGTAASIRASFTQID